MISDLERTADRMSAFHLYLIARIDNEEVEYCPSLAMAVQPSAFHVHVLSTTYWPKGSVSPLVFSSLKLPDSLFTIAEEFEKCFHTREGELSVLYDAPLSSTAHGSSKETNQFRTISLLTSKMNHTESDGDGDEGRLLSSSSLTQEGYGRGGRGGSGSGNAGVSRKRLLWCHGLGTVTLSFRCIAPRRTASSLYDPSSSTTSSLFMSPRTRPSSSHHHHQPQKHTLTLVVTTPQAAVLLALDTHHPWSSSSSFTSPEGKTGLGLGTNDSSMMGGPWGELGPSNNNNNNSSNNNSNNNEPHSTTRQSHPHHNHLTEQELSVVTGLHGEELRMLVQSLCDPSLPLLQKVSHSSINHEHKGNNNNNNNNNNNSQGVSREASMLMMHEQGMEWSYRLSDELLHGTLSCLGSNDQQFHRGTPATTSASAPGHTTTSTKLVQPYVTTDPTKWSQILTHLQQNQPISIQSALKTWRESLIDACIVRELKRASREKTGRVSAQINALQLNQWSHPVQECLTLEEVAMRVKLVLETNRLRNGLAPGRLDVMG